MNVIFLLIPFSTLVDYQTYLNTTLAILVIHMIFNMKPCILLGHEHPHA
jgi:hypothetical protein